MIDSFQNRLIQAMDEKNIKAAELAKITGLSKAQLSQYINGKYKAKQEGVYKLAKALNVSEGWLMGYDVPKDRAWDIAVEKKEAFIAYLESLGYEYVTTYKDVKIPKDKIPIEFQDEISGDYAIGSAEYCKIVDNKNNFTVMVEDDDINKFQEKSAEFLKGLILLHYQKQKRTEKIHQIKIAARNGSFEEKVISESELDKIKNLPDVDDLK